VNSIAGETEVLVTDTDSAEGFRGYLAIDRLTHAVAAGRFRVQKGLTAAHVARMARNMTLKHRLAGNRVDGAKSGIYYDPALPGKRNAMKRFLGAIRPYIITSYSMGPDMNTTLAEIDPIASELDIPSVKMAVARAQGLDLEEFLYRYRVLQEEIDGLALDGQRSGHGVAVACLATLRGMGVPIPEATAAIQGFGSVGSACARSLSRAGVRILAISDEDRSLICDDDGGLPIPGLLEGRGSLSLIGLETPPDSCRLASRDAIFRVPCDLFIPAAVENGIRADSARAMNVKAVVEAANLSVSRGAEDVFRERDILVIPDIVAGAGGVMSIGGLFGARQRPRAKDVLNHMETRMEALVSSVYRESRATGETPRTVALRMCARMPDRAGLPPYGEIA
jgi:glutamate dehydrogenase (NAD(P)+)